MDKLSRLFRKFILGPLAAFIYFVYHLTLRIKVDNAPEFIHGCGGRRHKPHDPILAAHWHGDELVFIGWWAFKKMAVMVSHSKDGDLMTGALTTLGYQVLRGSSSRGAEAGFLSLLRAVKGGASSTSLAVDGPKGPRHKVKPGIVKLAQLSGLPVYPVVVLSDQKFVFRKSWNQTYLPLPFSKVTIRWGSPFNLPKKITKEELEIESLRLEEQLKSLSK